jgi:dihydroflavonol-4-reductase
MEKILVTGANGFLGAWLTRYLLAEGYDVTALVRKKSDLSELNLNSPEMKALKLAYGDVSDMASLRLAFQNQQIVFHLAGIVSYKPADNALLQIVNVEGTRNVVDVCSEIKIKLLHVSSVVAIGAAFKPEVLNENFNYNIAHLQMAYFDTKKAAEDIVVTAARAGRIEAVCVNPSTIYGFGDARKGSRKNQIKVARQKLSFYTSGGVNVVPVEDVIKGILLAAKYGRNGERYLLTGENMTIKQLFQKIAKAAGVKAPSIYMPNWLLHTIGFFGDRLQTFGVDIGLSSVNAQTATMYHWFDSAKARQELGFMPTSADAAIEKSVGWMREHGYLA